MEQWNGGISGIIVKFATMTNDPVPHQIYSSVHTILYMQLSLSSQKGDREE